MKCSCPDWCTTKVKIAAMIVITIVVIGISFLIAALAGAFRASLEWEIEDVLGDLKDDKTLTDDDVSVRVTRILDRIKNIPAGSDEINALAEDTEINDFLDAADADEGASEAFQENADRIEVALIAKRVEHYNHLVEASTTTTSEGATGLDASETADEEAVKASDIDDLKADIIAMIGATSEDEKALFVGHAIIDTFSKSVAAEETVARLQTALSAPLGEGEVVPEEITNFKNGMLTAIQNVYEENWEGVLTDAEEDEFVKKSEYSVKILEMIQARLEAFPLDHPTYYEQEGVFESFKSLEKDIDTIINGPLTKRLSDVLTSNTETDENKLQLLDEILIRIEALADETELGEIDTLLESFMSTEDMFVKDVVDKTYVALYGTLDERLETLDSLEWSTVTSMGQIDDTIGNSSALKYGLRDLNQEALDALAEDITLPSEAAEGADLHVQDFLDVLRARLNLTSTNRRRLFMAESGFNGSW